VVVATYGRTPFGATAYIIGTRHDAVVQRLRLASDIVVATVSDGVVYLFNDKLGYVFRGATGEPLRSLFESDNYRGCTPRVARGTCRWTPKSRRWASTEAS
jgi:hypothetical protein